MKRLLLLGIGVMAATLGWAQVKVMGSLKDNKGRILAGSSVSIKDAYDGGLTDSTGKFRFRTFEKGNQMLVAKSIGYKTQEYPIVVEKDSIVVDFIMKEEISELKAVVITANSFEASDKKKSTVLRPLDIATTAGANADISATIQTLPGAQKVGEQEGLFIRGGSAEESKIIIDGSVVNNFFFSSVPGIAQRGRFSPFLFSGTQFTSGGYSALYGQALSAVLSLESIDLPERSEVQVGISPLFASVGFQQLGKNKKTSYGASYSYTDLALYQAVVPQAPDFYRRPVFHNMDANFRIKTKRGGMLKFYTYYNASDLALRRPSLDSIGMKNAFALTNFNSFSNVQWRQPLGKGWKLNASAAISFNNDLINSQLQNQQNAVVNNTGIPVLDAQNFNIRVTNTMWQVRGVLEKKFGAINAVRFGGELWKHTDSNSTRVFSSRFGGITNETYVAAFAESDLYITNELAFRPGLRMERSDLLNKTNIAPRASLSYKLNANSQLSFDYGIFYQTPERRYFRPWTPELNFQRADHYILTYQHLSRDYTFRTQVYYKDYAKLLRTDANALEAVNINGNGFAKGLELFWRDRKTIKGMDYWISYSYLDTRRLYLNYPMSAQPTFAATHSGSVVLKKFWVKQMFGVNWSWNWSTGRPYLNPNKPADQFLSDRTIFYSTNNFSLNWLTKIFKSNGVVVAGINNVFNEKQIFGYNYSNRLKDAAGQFIREAVTPPAPRSFFLGVFLSWGVDRTQQNINNNL